MKFYFLLFLSQLKHLKKKITLSRISTVERAPLKPPGTMMLKSLEPRPERILPQATSGKRQFGFILAQTTSGKRQFGFILAQTTSGKRVFDFILPQTNLIILFYFILPQTNLKILFYFILAHAIYKKVKFGFILEKDYLALFLHKRHLEKDYLVLFFHKQHLEIR